ncbi:CPBP family intramembrane glutamic endopeptidase, partial [Corynebacterium striatum]
LLVKSAANAFAEEVVVVYWFMTRLRQSGWGLPATLAASSILRGSYHLYQGVSAGFGNIVMGLVYGYFFHKTGKVWPLVIAHFLIDAVAFVGYAFLF